MKIKKRDKVRHLGTGVRFIVEAVHEDSNSFWARKDEPGSTPITYGWNDEMWEVIKPFFEEGKLYEHNRLPERTFKVETVRDGVAFGLLTPADGSSPLWTCRRRDDFQMWHDERERQQGEW